MATVTIYGVEHWGYVTRKSRQIMIYMQERVFPWLFVTRGNCLDQISLCEQLQKEIANGATLEQCERRLCQYICGVKIIFCIVLSLNSVCRADFSFQPNRCQQDHQLGHISSRKSTISKATARAPCLAVNVHCHCSRLAMLTAYSVSK